MNICGSGMSIAFDPALDVTCEVRLREHTSAGFG